MDMDMGEALKSIERTFPAADIGKKMQEIWDLAFKTRSAKSALAVLELALAYQYGKPIERQVSLKGSLDQFRELFMGEGEQQDAEGGDAVDVVVEGDFAVVEEEDE